ncbi:VWFA and cache domain-containing protein 1 [Labeo rohita]|uniref:VWFA and cache domain-containing protein 1 n=1 Tax=Labeo rohita TaxID=84645 RepID=A0ABQ8ML73_LABRO|nr:VWFA and cache domain-containing protein 1 [Labeo rohita]
MFCLLSDFRFDGNFNANVSKTISCDRLSPTVNSRAFNPGRDLNSVLADNLKSNPGIKWQYFSSEEGIFTVFPAHKPVYVSAVRPQSKHIVVIIDHGASVTETQLQIARDAALIILNSIDEHDKISVLTIADTVRSCSLDQCYKSFLSPATSETKRKMSTFINNIKASDSSTQHALGFQKAFQLLRNTSSVTRQPTNTDMVIIYLSSGITTRDSSEHEKRATLSVVKEENRHLNNSVMILTYALMNEGVTGLKELAFLRDLAEQNSVKYGVPDRSALPVVKGSMMVLNQLSNLETTVGRFYINLPNRMIDVASFSLPYADQMGDVGVDVNLAYILEDVTYYQDSLASYTFLIDNKGYTLMHPSLTRPYLMTEAPLHTDIIHYENIPGFAAVRQNILSLPLGSQVIAVPVNSSLSWHMNRLRDPSRDAYNVSYAWKLVQDTSFILCIVYVQPEIPVKQLKNLNTAPSSKLLYHRLDLLGQPSSCLHFKQLATVESPTVMLSAGSFSSPYEHLSQPETKRMVEHYTAYLSDNTRLIANPGLKSSVRNEVMATSHVTDEWMSLMEMSSLNCYIVRRYIATPNGVLRIYPGSLMDKAFDPTRRQWYLHAVANPGLITFTGPYLDVGGAGYVASGYTVAVMGIDFTLRYFYKVLLDLLPICNQDKGNKIRCFIMEDRGYLVAHPTLIDPKGHAPAEQQHITHKEPLVANDILNHPNFVKKNLCNSFSDRTVQRFYKFNTSIVGDLTNLVHGSHCSKYRLTRIPGTNAFAGIVNETCDSLAFCACSTVDRLCLNCHRMEQNECECPCECPLEVNECTGNLTNAENRNPSCDVHQEPLSLTVIEPSLQDTLPQCINTRCSQRFTSSDCFGVLDCEWCMVDSDGKTHLDKPYCALQKECFGGIVGAKSPYVDGLGILDEELASLNMIKSAPVGPVAGGIMGCIMVLVLAVYAYRHQIHRRSHQHMSPLAAQEMSVRMSNLDNERDDRDEDSHEDRGIISNTRFIAAVIERHTHSPERRRRYWGRSGTESDHGKSAYVCVYAWVTRSLQCMLNLPPLRDEAFWRSLCNQQEEKGQPYSTRRGAMRDLEEESQQREQHRSLFLCALTHYRSTNTESFRQEQRRYMTIRFRSRLQHHEPSGGQREPALQQRSSIRGRRCGQSRRGPRPGHASTDSCSPQPQVPPLSAPPHAPPPALAHASPPGCRHRAQRGCRVLILPTRDPKPTANPAFDATANFIHHLHSGPASSKNEERNLTPDSPWASANGGQRCFMLVGRIFDLCRGHMGMDLAGVYDTKLLMFFFPSFFFPMKMKGLFFYYLFKRSGDGDNEWKK